MPVKFYCNNCGKEIWQSMADYIKKSETVYHAEKRCLCSDCLLKEYHAIDNVANKKQKG